MFYLPLSPEQVHGEVGSGPRGFCHAAQPLATVVNEEPINYTFGSCLQIAVQLLSTKVQLSSSTTSHLTTAKHTEGLTWFPQLRRTISPLKTAN